MTRACSWAWRQRTKPPTVEPLNPAVSAPAALKAPPDHGFSPSPLASEAGAIVSVSMFAPPPSCGFHGPAVEALETVRGLHSPGSARWAVQYAKRSFLVPRFAITHSSLCRRRGAGNTSDQDRAGRGLQASALAAGRPTVSATEYHGTASQDSGWAHSRSPAHEWP